MLDIETDDFHLTQVKSSYKVFVYNSLYCKRLNKLLNTYEGAHFGKDSNEAVFHFNENQLKAVKKALKLKKLGIKV